MTSRGNRTRILLFHSDRQAAASVASFLRDAGYSVDVISRPEILLEEARRPDKRILVLESTSVADALLAPAAPSAPPLPPTILLTDPADVNLKIRAFERGVVSCLDVPVEPRRIREEVDRICRFGPSTDTSQIRIEVLTRDWIKVDAASRAECIEQLERLFTMIYDSRLPVEEKEELKLVLGEVLTNAVEWGNRKDPGKSLSVQYRLFPDRFLIRVVDEGEGFDAERYLDELLLAEAAERRGKRPGGLGLAIIHRLMDDVVFMKGGQGVMLVKTLA